jgi:hypothetical protein
MSCALSSGFSILIQGSYLKTLLTPLPIELQAYYPSPLFTERMKNPLDLGFQQLLFFMSSALGTAASLAAVPLFSTPLTLIKREDSSGIPVTTFAVGRMAADLIIVLWIAFMFLGTWVLFGHAGQWNNWMAVIISTSFVASSIGYVSAVASRPGRNRYIH